MPTHSIFMACRLPEPVVVPCMAIATPLGALRLTVADDGALVSAVFEDDASSKSCVPDQTALAVADRFHSYFAGDRTALDDVPVRPEGSPFQQAVWAELRRIPAGAVVSYAMIASRLGGAASGHGPNARAVGSANARNPIAVAIPCHRVIGADGSLTGYAGGLWRKKWLLEHEGSLPAQPGLL